MASENKQTLNTSKGHQWLTLIGATFVLFEIIFIGFYSNNFWFSWQLAWLGVPTIFVVALIAHFVLCLLEGNVGCWLASPVFKGKPPVVYRVWLKLDDDGFSFGKRHVRWDVVDRAVLTFFANLTIESRVICGEAQQKPDVVFKFPFSVALQEQQATFLAALQAARPSVEVNERLQKGISSPIVKGQNFVQACGAAMMLVLLFDLGYSSFYYLDMLKHFYLADVAALAGQIKDADRELAEGDNIRAHPLPISYVTTRFLNVGNCAEGISAARADALWHVGRKQEALAEAKKAIGYTPENFRVYLHYARLLEENGSPLDARAQMQKAVEKHKDALLPRLYLMANASDTNPKLVATVYKQSMDDLTEKLFIDEPVWPPGGGTFVHDVMYSHDLYFVFDRLLKVHLDPQQARGGQ